MIRLTRAWLARRRAAAMLRESQAAHMADAARYRAAAREAEARMLTMDDSPRARAAEWFRGAALRRRAAAAECRANGQHEWADQHIERAEEWEREHRAAAVRNGKRVCCGQVVATQVERIGA